MLKAFVPVDLFLAGTIFVRVLNPDNSHMPTEGKLHTAPWKTSWYVLHNKNDLLPGKNCSKDIECVI